MYGRVLIGLLVGLGVSATGAIAVAEVGTKGQNFDRIVFEAAPDGPVKLTARVMTINRFVDSSSSITVLDNGREVFGPETNSAERWTKSVSIEGAGKHEIVLRCQGVNASPVYCGLTLDDSRARLLE